MPRTQLGSRLWQVTRWVAYGLVVAAAGAVDCAGSAWTWPTYSRDDSLIRVTRFGGIQSPAVVLRGESVMLDVALSGPTTGTYAIDAADLSAEAEEDGIGQSPLPGGIGSFDPPFPGEDPLPIVVGFAGNVPAVGRINMKVAQDAPLGPAFVRVQLKHATDESRYITAIGTFIVAVGGGPPGLEWVSPNNGDLGAQVEIAILAANVSPPVTVHCLNPDVVPGPATFVPGGSDSEGEIRATLDILPHARTGRTQLFVVDAEGNRSEGLGFTVGFLRERPAVTGIFPNYAQPGVDGVHVIAGSGFATGCGLAAVDIPAARCRKSGTHDTRSFRSFVEIAGGTAPVSVGLFVDAITGMSDPADVFAVAPEFAAPVISSVTPSSLTVGTDALVRIRGQNLADVADNGVFIVDLDAVGRPFHTTEVVSASAGAVVVRLLGYPGEHAVQPTATGTVQIALVTNDGWKSNCLPLRIAEVPVGFPRLLRAGVGTIRRGETIVETLHGGGLVRIQRVEIEGGGVSRTGDVTYSDGGRRITVSLRARPDAALTADGPTNLVAITDEGRRSNLLAYEVLDAETPGDCVVDLSNGGADLVVTGAGGYERSVVRVVPPAADGGFPGKTKVIAGNDSVYRYVQVTLDDDPANLLVGAVQAVDISYFDGTVNFWQHQGGVTLHVVEASPTRVGLCIEADIPMYSGTPGPDAPATVHISGTLVFTR